MNMYAIFLNSSAPKEFLELTASYQHDLFGQKFLGAKEVTHLGAFIACQLAEEIKDEKPWAMQFPISYVLAIAEMPAGKQPAGFLPSSSG